MPTATAEEGSVGEASARRVVPELIVAVMRPGRVGRALITGQQTAQLPGQLPCRQPEEG